MSFDSSVKIKRNCVEKYSGEWELGHIIFLFQQILRWWAVSYHFTDRVKIETLPKAFLSCNDKHTRKKTQKYPPLFFSPRHSHLSSFSLPLSRSLPLSLTHSLIHNFNAHSQTLAHYFSGRFFWPENRQVVPWSASEFHAFIGENNLLFLPDFCKLKS